MHEASGSAMEPLPVTAHLLQPLIERAARDPGRPVAAYRDGDRFVDVTAADSTDAFVISHRASSRAAWKKAIASH